MYLITENIVPEWGIKHSSGLICGNVNLYFIHNSSEYIAQQQSSSAAARAQAAEQLRNSLTSKNLLFSP